MNELTKQIIEDFCSETNKADSTKKSYTIAMNDFLNYANINCISHSDKNLCDAYHNHILSLGASEKYSYRTVYVKLVALSSIFDFAVNNRSRYSLPEAFTNHFQIVEKPQYSVHVNRNRIIAVDELAKLNAYLLANNLQLYAIVQLVSIASLKTKEILELRLNNIIKDNNGRFGIVYNKKFGTDFVKLPLTVYDALHNYIDKHRVQSKGYEDYVFIDDLNLKPLTERNVQRRFKSACNKAGIGEYTLADLRNSAGAYMISGGASKQDVADYLRYNTQWASRYDHVVPELERAACDSSALISASALSSVSDYRVLNAANYNLALNGIDISTITVYGSIADAIADGNYLKGKEILKGLYMVDAPLCVIEDSYSHKHWFNCFSLEYGSMSYFTTEKMLREVCGNVTSIDIYSLRKLEIDKKGNIISIVTTKAHPNLSEYGMFAIHEEKLVYISKTEALPLSIFSILCKDGDNKTLTTKECFETGRYITDKRLVSEPRYFQDIFFNDNIEIWQ